MYNCHIAFFLEEVRGDKKQWHLAQTLQIRETILKEYQQKIEKNENNTWQIELIREFRKVQISLHLQPAITVTVEPDLRAIKFFCHKTKMLGRNRNTQMPYYFRKNM